MSPTITQPCHLQNLTWHHLIEGLSVVVIKLRAKLHQCLVDSRGARPYHFHPHDSDLPQVCSFDDGSLVRDFQFSFPERNGPQLCLVGHAAVSRTCMFDRRVASLGYPPT